MAAWTKLKLVRVLFESASTPFIATTLLSKFGKTKAPLASLVLLVSSPSRIKSPFTSRKTDASLIYPSTTTPEIFATPLTLTLADEFPPAPVQERLKLLLPGLEIVKSSFPLTAFDPDHEPEAEQLVAFVDDQVRVTVSPTIIDVDDAESDVVGDGSTGAEDPPPPPPPQAAISNIEKAIPKTLFFCIKDSLKPGMFINIFTSSSLSYFYDFCVQTILKQAKIIQEAKSEK